MCNQVNFIIKKFDDIVTKSPFSSCNSNEKLPKGRYKEMQNGVSRSHYLPRLR